jgi:hypothetical protein
MINPYYTHQKYLESELSNLPAYSKVLELGIGDGSSPLMYKFCENNKNCKVYAFETDKSWFDKMNSKYGSLDNYIFTYLNSWDDLKNHIKNTYALAFVDQIPWESRIESIDLLKDICNIFILHDYDYFNKPEYSHSSIKCNNIYINDETSWLGKRYSKDFAMEDNYEFLPPTVVLRKI